MQRRILAIRLALLVGGGLMALVLGELALRAQDAYSPASFHLLPPHSRLRDVQTGWDLFYETNAQGWRDDEYARTKPAGVLRIATLGDSFTFGQGCPRGEIFPDVLEALLNARGEKAQVLNLSSPGLGPEGDFVLLEEALRYRPDVVVVSFYANDATGQPTPWFNGAVRDLSRHFRLFVLARDIRRRIASPPDIGRDDVRWGGVPLPPPDFQRKYGQPRTNLVAACLTDPTEVARWSDVPEGRGWEELALYAGRMARACRASGCRLVFTAIPDGAQVDPRQWDIRRQLGVKVSATAMMDSRFQSLVRDLAQREGAGFFDPLEEFRRVRAGLYFPLDLHWTPVGHRVYAYALARYLARTPAPARTP